MDELTQGLLALLVAGGVALGLHALAMLVFRRLPEHRTMEKTVAERARVPSRILFVLVALLLVLPMVGLAEGPQAAVHRMLEVLLILTGAWLLIGATHIFEDVIEARFPADVADNLLARRIHTKVRLLRRVVSTVIGFLALALILITFPAVRQIGVTLFASAGVAGLVLGIAAQPTLSNLVAGLQLALTEPIRLDDVVIVNGEWGRIEEINMTYVVVRIWDLRRLVVPLRWFIENPFENWTRQTADILASVFLFLDYRAPIDALRKELDRILENEAADLWDGKVNVVQVVDATEGTLKVRALTSAASSGTAWDLRCLVREKLVDFLRREHPEALPRVRATVRGDGGTGGGDRPPLTPDFA